MACPHAHKTKHSCTLTDAAQLQVHALLTCAKSQAHACKHAQSLLPAYTRSHGCASKHMLSHTLALNFPCQVARTYSSHSKLIHAHALANSGPRTRTHMRMHVLRQSSPCSHKQHGVARSQVRVHPHGEHTQTLMHTSTRAHWRTHPCIHPHEHSDAHTHAITHTSDTDAHTHAFTHTSTQAHTPLHSPARAHGCTPPWAHPHKSTDAHMHAFTHTSAKTLTPLHSPCSMVLPSLV